jgi:glycerol-3-phosphate acyltransferase PlsY
VSKCGPHTTRRRSRTTGDDRDDIEPSPRRPLRYPVLALLAAAVAALGFLTGSIPFGVLLARRRGVDIRATGSGNIGATNVARVIGVRLGVIVLVLDAIKGALPVALAQRLDLGDPAIAVTGLAAVCGHCFSPWLRLRGGKGVATALGVFVVVAPIAAGIAVAVFAVVAAATRIPAVGSLVATLVLAGVCATRSSPPIALLAAACAALIFVRHRSNLVRLLGRDDRPDQPID